MPWGLTSPGLGTQRWAAPAIGTCVPRAWRLCYLPAGYDPAERSRGKQPCWVTSSEPGGALSFYFLALLPQMGYWGAPERAMPPARCAPTTVLQTAGGFWLVGGQGDRRDRGQSGKPTSLSLGIYFLEVGLALRMRPPLMSGPGWDFRGPPETRQG